MSERTIEDRLRAEYFDLLPTIRRVTEDLEAETKYCMLPITRSLLKFERVEVKSRIKACDSAVDSLRRRQEGATFDSERDSVKPYTLKDLKDLAGVRVLAFPQSRLKQIDEKLRPVFLSWKADPVTGDRDEILAFKYSGLCPVSNEIRGNTRLFPF